MPGQHDHRFPQYCLDGNALVERKTLRTYVKTLGQQAMTAEAAEAYSEKPREKYRSDKEYGKRGYLSPSYFGEGGEFLRHCYFEFFGRKHRLENVWSLNKGHGAVPVDMGWDGGATCTDSGAPVYIQDKTTEKHGNFHEMNDGSRIMNFAGSAAMHAIASGHGNDARFVVWTTAKGLHPTLEARMHGRVEVVACQAIGGSVDGNTDFWDMVSGKLAKGRGE